MEQALSEKQDLLSQVASCLTWLNQAEKHLSSQKPLGSDYYAVHAQYTAHQVGKEERGKRGGEGGVGEGGERGGREGERKGGDGREGKGRDEDVSRGEERTGKSRRMEGGRGN